MVEAREAFDLSREPVSVHRLYGDTAMGRQCMLEETLIVWAGEFGRTPTTDHNGGLQLDSAARLRRGGVSGAVVVPGKPEESRLLHAVRGEKGMEAMPPDDPPELAFVLTSLIPERYNKKSTLTVDVQSPSDRPEFVLTTRKD